MAESPDAISEAIVETRQDLADTIQALGHKADVKGRVTDKVHEATDKAGAQVRSTAHEVGERVERVDTRTPLLIGLLALVVLVAVPWLRSRRRQR